MLFGSNKEGVLLTITPTSKRFKETLENIGMLCMQEFFLGCGWITSNIVSDVYILTKGKKSINAEENENVELTHTQVFCGRLCVLCE